MIPYVELYFRALEVFKDHGQRLSDIIADQRRLPGKIHQKQFPDTGHFNIINH